MTILRQGWGRLVSFFRKQHLDREFDEELAAHIELATQDHIRLGMTLPQARRLALIRLGGIEPSKELHRDSRGLPWLDGIVQDVRFAFRALRRSPGFTAVAVTTLAVGIGVNAAVFTVANAVLFKGFPMVERNDRILYIGENGSGCCVSWPDFEDWRSQAKSFTGMGAMADLIVILSDNNGLPERYDASLISANSFGLLGQRPVLGRDFTPSDETPGAAPVAILSYGFWERRYGGDPAIVGRTARINGALTTVIGVMPRGFSFPQREDLWMPLVPTPDLQKREARALWFAFGRMADGVSIGDVRTEMKTVGNRLETAYPLTNRGVLPAVQSFHEFFIGRDAATEYGSMWCAVGFVLLIACANLANLLLARSIDRFREISVRIALGAGRWRIVRQLLIESTMLSVSGGVFAWWIAKWSVRAYALATASPYRILDYTMDLRVFAYFLAISTGTGLLFGLAPVGRLLKLDINAALKGGSRSATGGGRAKHLSNLLVIGEMALATVLLAGAGVMIRSFLNIYAADTGVNKENILTMYLALSDARYSRSETQISFYDRLKTRLEAIPGVESVAVADYYPTQSPRRLPYQLAGAADEDEQRRPTLSALVIGPGYFRTLGATALSGREFNNFDGAAGIPTVIVNRRFADEYWPGENPLGKRLRLFDGRTPEDWRTVVGVASNIVQNGRQEFDPLIYLPYRQKPAAAMWVFARTRVPPGNLATAFRREIQAMDSDLPIWIGPVTLAERLELSYRNNRIDGVMFLIFAAIALLLASVGLYAVMAYSVSRRTREIGIRMAIGATAGEIRKLIFLQGMLPLGIGLAIGLPISFALNRVLKSELVHVSPADPLTLIAASVILTSAALLGCWIPAQRAMRVDPVIALRNE